MPRTDARRAMNRCARSAWILGILCALLAAACGDGEPPATPASQRYGLDGLNDDLAHVRWDPSPGAKTYAVFHATRPDADCQAAFEHVQASSDQATVSPPSSSSGCVALAQGLHTLGLSHQRLHGPPGGEHYFWVVACNDAGCSPIDRENPALPPPAAPARIQAELDGSGVRISWDPVDGASEYQVYRCEGEWCERIAPSVRETSFVHQLPVRQPWGVEVIDRSEDSLSLRWAEVHGDSVYLRYQVAACHSDFCSTAAVATLSFVDIGRYLLHRRTADNQFAVVRDDLTLGQYVDQNLDPDTTYYYTVQYCNDAGCSPQSDETGGLTEAQGPVDRPPTPSGFRGEKIDITAGGDDARVSWLTVEGATWYEVEQGGISFKLDARISAPQTSHYDGKPNRGVFGTYQTTRYKVRACNKAGCSSFTDVVTLE